MRRELTALRGVQDSSLAADDGAQAIRALLLLAVGAVLLLLLLLVAVLVVVGAVLLGGVVVTGALVVAAVQQVESQSGSCLDHSALFQVRGGHGIVW